ncbi:hypothetical protein D3C85_784190 [compost metagenome]
MQRNDNLAGRKQRIGRSMWHCSMTANARHNHFEGRACGHQRAGSGTDMADRQARPVVNSEDRLARESVEQTILNHRTPPSQPLFGRLKDEVHDPIEVALQRQVASSAQKHARVSIMTTGVHHSSVLRAMLESVRLLNGERIHVGSKADCTRAPTPAKRSHHARLSDAASHLDTPLGQALCDKLRRAVDVITQLGPSMQVPAKGTNHVGGGDDFGNQLHGFTWAFSVSGALHVRTDGRTVTAFHGSLGLGSS